MVNGDVQQGQNVLITGVGGGVALLALQLCVAKGASVYVTSSNPEKIQKAIQMGAKGGVNYKDGQLSKLTLSTESRNYRTDMCFWT
jgi:NADPH:quinone reductase-like Zn-dependent oxidoreductase